MQDKIPAEWVEAAPLLISMVRRLIASHSNADLARISDWTPDAVADVIKHAESTRTEAKELITRLNAWGNDLYAI